MTIISKENSVVQLNKVFVTGNLCREWELRFTPAGFAVADTAVAVNRSWKDKNEEWQEETAFIELTVWGKLAERCAETQSKGTPVLVEGRLQQDNWVDKASGGKRSKLVIVADRVQKLHIEQKEEASVLKGDTAHGETLGDGVAATNDDMPVTDDVTEVEVRTKEQCQPVKGIVHKSQGSCSVKVQKFVDRSQELKKSVEVEEEQEEKFWLE